MFSAKITITEQKDFLNACALALKPESRFETKRAKFEVNLDSDLNINISAEDAIAFRAILNTLTSLLAIAQQAWQKE
ncbi:MAG: KEOPS complex subunit Pcc1 [Candidatus Nanoarchaeia archaeon]